MFWLMFLVYLGLLLKLVLFKFITPLDLLQGVKGTYYQTNFVPFTAIKGSWSTVNIWGNVLLFMPLGVYLSLLKGKGGFIKTLVMIFSFSFLLELTQLLLHIGAADVDDLILNTTGGLLGMALAKGLLLCCRGDRKQVLNIVTNISCVIGLPIVIYFLVLLIGI